MNNRLTASNQSIAVSIIAMFLRRLADAAQHQLVRQRQLGAPVQVGLLALAVGGLDVDDLERAKIVSKSSGKVSLLTPKERLRRGAQAGAWPEFLHAPLPRSPGISNDY